jgi:hypothetical protein
VLPHVFHNLGDALGCAQGAGAFAEGLGPRMLVQAPLFGCTLLSYEILKAVYRGQAAPAARA